MDVFVIIIFALALGILLLFLAVVPLRKFTMRKDLREMSGIFNNNPNPVIKTDRKGSILFSNPAAKEIFLQNIQGKSIYTILPGLMENLFSKSDIPGITRFHKTISGRDYTFLIKRDKEEKSYLFYGNDITYRREVEEELKRLKVAVEQSANVIIITDSEGQILFANRAFEKVTGYSPEEAYGKNPKILKSDYHSRDFYKELWDTVRNGEIWHGEFFNRRKDGSTFWEEAVITPILDGSGRVRNFIAVKEDITAEKKAEQDLVTAKKEAEQANRMKSEFLANMSHEIRTPMNAILGFTDILIEESNDSDALDKLEIIRQSGKSLMTLLNDILDFSKIEAGKIELNNSPFAIRRTMEHLYSIFENKTSSKGLAFTVEIGSELPDYVSGDEYRLKQVLTNLLSNAIKFTDQGQIILDIRYGDGSLTAAVTDTGIGIAPAKLEKIFSAFEQGDTSMEKKYGGTGLGLAISLRLAKLMGGALNVRSQQGEGSTFSLTVPLTPVGEEQYSEKIGDSLVEEEIQSQNLKQKKGEVNIPEDLSDEDESEIRLLVAEDNNINQKLICTLVKNLHLTCDTADNGLEALNMLKEKKYHLLLLDMEMPVMDGIETIQQIRRENNLHDLYVIALTAHALKGDAEKYIQYGCNDYIAKPLDRAVFEAKIQEQIVKWRSSPPSTSAAEGNVNVFLRELKENSSIFNPEKIIKAAERIKNTSEYKRYHWHAEKLIEAASQFDDEEVRSIIEEMENF